MALPNKIPGQYVRLKVGDGASTEIFSFLCGTNSINFKRDVKMSETPAYDCVDVLAPAVILRDVESVDHSFSVDGLFTPEAFGIVIGLDPAKSHNCICEVFDKDPTNTTIAPIGLKANFRISGKFFIKSLDLGAKYGDQTSLKLDFDASGATTIADLRS